MAAGAARSAPGWSARGRRRCCRPRPAAPPLQHELDAPAVVVDVQPVADVAPVAVERHLAAVEQVGDEQRDDLLRELVGAVVVAAAGDRDVEAVGAVVGAGDQVAPAFAAEYGEFGSQRRVLVPRADVDGAVDLVGGRRARRGRRRRPRRRRAASARRGRWSATKSAAPGDADRSTWRLGGEVDDRLVPGRAASSGCAVGDVALDEGVARVVGDRREVGRVAGVRQLVEDGDLDVVQPG